MRQLIKIYINGRNILMDFFVKLKLINSSSSYGNIFIDSNGRIVKVQTLITGLHYNKKTEQYYDSSVNLGKEKASRYYPKGSILQYFRHKEGISKKDFKNEVKIQKKIYWKVLITFFCLFHM